MSKLRAMVAVGQIVKKSIFNDKTIVKVRTHKMKLNRNLLMYFPQKAERWSLDINGEAKVGDIVVVRNLDEKFGRNINTKVDSFLYQVGAVRDPITDRLCRGTEFIDEEERSREQSMRTTVTARKS